MAAGTCQRAVQEAHALCSCVDRSRAARADETRTSRFSGEPLSRYGVMAFFVDHGDDSDPDGDGRPGLTCETTGPTSPFRDSVSSGYSHTYRKTDTYTITATGYYCGEGGLQTVEKTTTVNIAKPAPAPKVSAAAHIEYTVDGLTATLVPSIAGTQHEMKYGRNKHAKYGVPLVYTMSFPEGAEVSGGATKGGIKRATCTKHGSVEFDPVMLSGDPVVGTFPKPGTYEVTLSADACTSQRIVSKTVTIAVPPTAATTPGTGPKVETDRVGDDTNALSLGVAGLVGAGALIAYCRERIPLSSH